VEGAPTSKHPATDWSDNVQGQVRNGIRLDGERKHQRLREGAPRCRQVGIGRLFVQVSAIASSLLIIR